MHDGYEAARQRIVELLDEKVGMLKELNLLSTQVRDLRLQRDELVVALQYSVKQVPELATVPGIEVVLAKLGADRTGEV